MGITPKLISSIGLVFDIVGAWLICYEFLYQFKKPEKYEPQPQKLNGEDPDPKLSGEYKKWESKKYKFMLTGLILLTIGVGFQIWSNYLPIRNQTQTAINELKKNNCAKPKYTQNADRVDAPISSGTIDNIIMKPRK